MISELVRRFRDHSIFMALLGRKSTHKRLSSLKNRRRALAQLEGLEERMVLSTLTVTNLLDDGSTGSLRWAVTQANTSAGDDTIDFDSTVFATAQTITLGGSRLELTDTTGTTTITGPTAGVTVDANHANEVFKIDEGVTATLAGLTITGGTGSNAGGVLNQGTVTLVGCTLTGNHAGMNGGGMWNAGTATLTNCTITANTSANNGGGLANFGTATLTGSTINNNTSAGYGGGMGNSGTATLTNCTISGNSLAAQYTRGGGFFNYGNSTTLTNCTITNNYAIAGSGVYIKSGTVSLGNTIIAANLRGTTDTFGTFNSLGNNLIGSAAYRRTGYALSSGWVSTDLTGTHLRPLNPHLSALGNYGGPTQTVALLPGSPAIDAGSSTGAPTTDQRGLSRVGGVDIGAFESQGFTLSTVAGSTPQSADIGSLFANPLAVTIIANNPVEPVEGGVVNYLSQPASGGAGAVFLAASPVISGGQASMPTMPNNALGSYTVVASAGGSNTTSFNLTNTGQAFASLLVNTTSNSPTPGAGLLSLPEAVYFAGADQTGGQTIGFDSTVFATPQVITLSGTQLELAKDVTINGPAAGVTISGNNTSRVLMIDTGVTAALAGLTITAGNVSNNGGGVYNDGTVTLDHCTISGNTAQNGGGLYNYTGTVTLTNCTISGNTATSEGGGLYSQHGTLSINTCTITANTSEYEGGGVSNHDTATILNSLISGNTAVYGGGVYSYGTTTVLNSTISGNTATSEGGGFYIEGGDLNITNSTVSGNSADWGGGFYDYWGTVTLTNSTISQNTASHSAGAMYSDQQITLINSTVTGNSAPICGGVYASSDVILTNTIVAGNTATTSNPDVKGTFTSQGYNLIGQTDGSSGWVGTDLTGTSASPLDAMLAPLGNYGGPTQTMPLQAGSPAIAAGTSTLAPTIDQRGFARGASLDIGAFQTGSLVVNTTADGLVTPSGILDLRQAINLANVQTGADAITFDSTVFATAQTITLGGTQLELSDTTGTTTITGPTAGVTVDANHASRVLMIDAGVTASLTGLTITGGSADKGGGVYNAGTATITDSTITGNAAINGGGILSFEGTLTLTNSTVLANSASITGGGIGNAVSRPANTSTLTIINSSVNGNTARSGAGVENDSVATITDSSINDNTAVQNGSGVSNYGTLTLTNSTVSGNHGAVSGGGVSNVGQLTMNNSSVTGNTASNGGGGLYNTQTATINNSSITGNTSSNWGGGVSNYGTFALTGSTVSGNSAKYGAGVYTGAGTVTLTNSTIIQNSASINGGGVSTWGNGTTVTITNSTISQNSAPDGGGIYNWPGSTARLTNTIVAGNSATGAGPDVKGTASSQGYNLIGKTNGSTGWVSTDLTGTTASPLDALLAPLGNYGGTTQTMPLLPGSPAINAGTSTGAPTTDQRGQGRVGGVDIGAFESQGFTLTPVAGSTPQAAYVDAVFSQGLGVSVTANNPVEPVNGGFLTFNTPGSGASAVLSAGKIVIAGGAASATATANHTAGAYNVTANANGATSAATFALTNTARSTTTTLSSSTNPSAQGSSVTFTATVTSGATGTVTFKDGSNVLGTGTISGNTATFSTSSLTAGSHSITAVYNSDGAYATSTSNAITQVVAAAPLVTSNPTGQSVNTGATATFTATAIGNPAPTVQWQISTNGGSAWANINGATSASYTTPATSAGNDGAMYRAVFINSLGSASTSAATLRVNQAPAVSSQPASVTTNTGSAATFTAAATGSPAPTVQWQSNSGGGWTDIPGATSTSYSTLASGNNNTQFRAVFTNTFGSVTSNPATLNIAVVANVSSTSVGWGTQTANLVDAGNGRLLPAGRTTDIPWLGINKITLTLSQGIASLAASDVTVRGVAGFTYSVASVTGSGTTWTINLAGTGLANPDKVTVTVGNSSLASYSKRLDVLPGDVNDDGLVNVADQMLVSRQLTGAYIVFYDIDGSGTLSNDDVSKIKARIGNKLPA